MRTLLTRTAERVGPAPRAVVSGLFPPLSDELKTEPALVRWAGLRDSVWCEGKVRWGCAIAPPRAFRGEEQQDHAMLVVVADEEGASPGLLHVVAMRISDLLRQGVEDPRLSAFEAVLQIGVQNLAVPTELGGTVPCRVFTVVVDRDAIPRRALVHSLFPVVVDWQSQAAMLVPSSYWDPRWSQAWQTGFVAASQPRRPNDARLRFARRLNERSTWAYRALVTLLAWLPGALVIGPIVAGLIATTLFAAVFWLQPTLASLAWAVAGLVLAGPGVFAAIVAAMRAPVLDGVGLGGERVGDDEAPELWALVREVESRLDVMPVDQVILDRSFDVVVHDRTPAVPLAKPRTVLVIGIPLLLSVSPIHIRSLLVQALADGTTGWRATRRRMSRHEGWVQGWRQGQSAHAFDRGAGRWIAAYADLFYDLGSLVARESLLEADRMAAGLTGAQSFADAIIRARVLEGWWQTRWDRSSFQGSEGSGPVPRPLARWRARGPELNPTMARLALTASLRRSDTAVYPPAPGERLRVLGVRGRLVGDPSAVACTLLGGATLRMIDHVDDLFAVHFGETWRRSRHAAMRAHRRRDALAGLSPARRSLFQHLELVELSRKLDEPFLAAQHGLEAASFFPRQAEAQLQAGMALLDVGDEQGLGCLRKALQLEPGLAPKACAAAMRFLQDRDMRAEMEAWGELWSQARGALSEETVRQTPAIVVQALASTSTS